MPRVNRRPSAPQPQTLRCRYADDRGRCRSIATVGGFCRGHADEIEDSMGQRSPVESIFAAVKKWTETAIGQAHQEEVDFDELVHAGLAAAGRRLRAHMESRAQQQPAAGQPPGAPPRQPPPPRGRVAPEAIAARKADIAARGTLGFGPDEPLTEAQIKARRQQLARLCHPDGATGKDPTREDMARKINAAADLLLKAARAAR